jgi:hypothetical protein
MSSALAIASVSYVLKDLLNDGMIDNDITDALTGSVKVTALPPDMIDLTAQNSTSQLNLFMYRVTPNVGWRNMDMPSMSSRGDRLTNPPLALDMHYLLTAYGADELHSEILLGYGMQLLHETPVLTREAIRTSLAPPTTVSGGGLPPELQALSTSELAEQFELIKITPNTLSTEEISKLWAAFQAKYRPTAAYVVSVVLIESKKTTKTSLPVRERGVYAIPVEQPAIEKIWSHSGPSAEIVENQKILEDYNLVLSGYNLKGDVVLVDIGGIEVSPETEDISDDQIIVALPGQLQAGIHGVRVIHQVMMGSPEEPHRGLESKVEAFVLSPRIDTINVTNVEGSGGEPRSADIELTIHPAITENQRVELLLNQFFAGPATTPALSYRFQAPPMATADPPPPTENITIPVSGVQAGNYLVRVRVDGAESPLEQAPDGKYNNPLLNIS